MSRTRSRSSTVAAIAAAAMMFGCAAEDGDGNDDNGVDDNDASDNGASDNGESDGEDGSVGEQREDVVNENFDPEEAQERADALIGTHEDDVDEFPAARIMHRGDEDLGGTADLVLGRANVTVDEVDGEWIVTRVEIETDPDDPPIVADVHAVDEDDQDMDRPQDFNHNEAQQRADDLIGTPEEDVPEDDETRIVARGDESFPTTDDLVPGRANVTLDEVDGEWVVTHVMVETHGDAPSIEANMDTD